MPSEPSDAARKLAEQIIGTVAWPYFRQLSAAQSAREQDRVMDLFQAALDAAKRERDEACKRALANDREIRDDHWRRIVAAAEHRTEVAAHDAKAEAYERAAKESRCQDR